MTSEKGGVIHDVKNEERGRHVKDREEGAYMTGACMMSEAEERVGRHDVRDRGEGKA